MNRLLIVDDEPDIRDSLQEVFEEEGYDVVTAKNGREALDVLTTQSHFCCVILDLVMPVMSGTEVHAALQQDARLARVPVIISTSDPSRAPSGTLIMRKPVNLTLLISTVSRICQEEAREP